jgi:hypothetical protein
MEAANQGVCMTDAQTAARRSCELWNSCYGNRMPWSIRNVHGPALLVKLFAELLGLQDRNPIGFVVRLHVLGDFYSVEYVEFWRLALNAFPALRVFGYTARDDEIGAALRQLSLDSWDRFAIRSSGAKLADVPAAIVVRTEADAGNAIVCPAQTGKTDCCATCGLCWHSKRPIAFIQH